MSKILREDTGKKLQIEGGTSRFSNESQSSQQQYEAELGDYTPLIHAAERKTRRRHKRSDQIMSAFKKSIQGRMFRKVSFVLAGIVVFATTYSLILPALTLDYDSLSDLPGLHLGEKPVVVEVLNSETAGRDDGDLLYSGSSSASTDAADAVPSDSVENSADVKGMANAVEKTASDTDQGMNNATGTNEAVQNDDAVDTHKEILWVDKDADQAEIDRAVESTFGDQAVKSQEEQLVEGQNVEKNPVPEQTQPESEHQATEPQPVQKETTAVVPGDQQNTLMPSESTEEPDSGTTVISEAKPVATETSGESDEKVFDEQAAAEQNNVGDTQQADVPPEEPAENLLPVPNPSDEITQNESVESRESNITTETEEGAENPELTAKPETWLENIANTALNQNVTTLTFDGMDYHVIATGVTGTAIPEGAILDVQEIVQGTKEYDGYEESAKEHLSDPNAEVVTQRFFDISFLVNGKKIEPTDGVTVQIQFDQAQEVREDQKLSVVHFADAVTADHAAVAEEPAENENGVAIETTEVVETTEPEITAESKAEVAEVLTTTPAITDEGKIESVSFETGSFSVFGVVYTVDFHYEVDGKMYEFSIPGGGFVSLEHLVESLGIIEDTRKFVADVASVKFSNPVLVEVSKVDADTTVGQLKESRGLECQYSAEVTEEQIKEINSTEIESGDWALISLHPFTSEETLTVTMKNGEVFTVKVTDAQLTKNFITASGETYTITVNYGKDAEIPEGAKLEVSELANDNEEYTEYVEQAAKALAKGEETPFVNAARLFDISIIADGRKIEPKAPVEVKIAYAKAENLNETSEVGTIHFKESTLETETEVMDIDVQGEEGKVEGITFTTDSFSIYAVIIIDKESGTFVVEDENYKVTITYTKEANIPVGTKLTVESIDPESAKYAELWKKTIEKINEGVEWTNQDEPDPRKGLTDAVFLDITLNYQGEKFEPEVPLGVKIECKNGGVLTPPNEEPLVIHFADQSTELISDVQTESIEREMPYLTGVLKDSSLTSTFVYEQDGFSIVGVASTGEYIDINENNISGAPLQLMAAQPGLTSISASKTVEDTDGDGVYELALNVTGASDSSTSTKVDKSNVVIVIDVSGSMRRSTYSTYTYSADTYDSDTTYYRNNDNTNRTCFYVEEGNYQYGQRYVYLTSGWYYEQGGSLRSYTGTVYTRPTQLEATQSAAKALVDALLSNNKPAGTIADDGVTRLDDIIEISLIHFSDDASVDSSKSVSKEDLDEKIDKLRAAGVTNWEDALDKAYEEANKYSSQTGENTSVIFLTDGVPTYANNYPLNDRYAGYEEDWNIQPCWNAARDEARKIVTNGYTLYNIFTFGNIEGSSDYLKALTNYAYTGTGTYDSTETTSYTRNYFFDAKDTTALTAAFQKIINIINNVVGYGGVDVEDGVTLGVTSTSVTVDGMVHDETLRYTVRNGNNIVYSVKIDNGVATFTIPGKEGTYTDNTPETVTTIIDQNDRSKDITSTVYSVEVDGKTYAMSPAIINQETGLVDWDLAGLGILEDDYTYTVAFDVWPNQYSYDIVADLNNGLKTLDQIKADLIEKYGEEKGTAVYNQILTSLLEPDANGQYSILTNWKQEVNYYTVDTTSDDQGHETTTYTPHDPKVLPNPDPIALTSKPVPMVKVWNSNLSPDQIGNLLYKDYPTNDEPTEYRVTLHLWKADTANEFKTLIDRYAGDPTTASANDYIEKTLGWNGTEYDWDDSVSIAPGTMISLQTAIDMGLDTTSAEHQKNIVTYNGAQYYIIETGHYYSVTEDNIDWHFELETVLYHPMKVDGHLKNVTFITDHDGNITGVEDIEDMTQVTATNSKTAELDITKKVVDNTRKMTQSQIDAETFTYKVTLTVPKDADMSHTNALEWVARYNDDPSASNRYIVYGYQTSEGADIRGLDDDVDRFDKKVYGQYTVSYPGGAATLDEIFTNDSNGTTKSGTIYITLMQNEVIRFTNLPSGTQYRIEEMYNNLYQANPSQDNYANLGGDAPASNVEANGYTVTVNTKNGNPTVSGRVVTGTIDKLNKRYYNQFTNTLDDTAVVDLDVTKHLQGYEWKGDQYYMKLETAEENTPLPRITTRYLSANSGTDDVTFNFGSVHLKPGTYTYTISETDSNYDKVLSGTIVNGITYDSVKTIKVTVANDLSITIAEGSSEGVTYDSAANTIKTKVTNKAAPLSIYKFGGSGLDEVDNKLVGVQFKLYSDAALTQQVTVDARGNAIGNNGLITTGEDGTASLGILKVGNYYLVETGLGNNPGYISATEPIQIVVDSRITYKQIGWSPSERYSSASAASDLVKANGGMFINYADDGTTIGGYTFTINNSTGVELPSTGGPGTMLIYGLGAVVAEITGYNILSKRRKKYLNGQKHKVMKKRWS